VPQGTSIAAAKGRQTFSRSIRMTFSPAIQASGITGWRLLNATYPRQISAFSNSPLLSREVTYFKDKIGDIQGASDLVSDPVLRKVALGAFGLEDDFANTFFIQRILGDGTGSPDALPNRLTDLRYREFSDAFGLGPNGARNTAQPVLMADIAERYVSQSFASKVGEQDNDLRLALNLKTAFPEITDKSTDLDTKWFLIMGNPPLRTVFTTALGLPSAIGRLDIDLQLSIFKESSLDQLGTENLDEIAETERLGALTDRFLARSQISNAVSAGSPASVALTLLQNAQFAF